MASECGLGSCRPSWLGRFATYHTFLVVYGLLGTIQAMAFIYFVATLTTLEKRFKITSQTTGIVMSGNEVSQIMLSLYLSYYGGRGNRPLWISVGVALSALSCLILALPHLMYGAGEDALSLTVEYMDYKMINSTYNAEEATALCSDKPPTERCDAEAYSKVPIITIFISQFVLGIGTTLYYALGQTYLDDNTKKVQTPMLLGMVMSLRSVGPALGFLLGFGCLSVYIDPTLTPVIDKKDPRWLGAWWLGWIILGLAMFLFAFLIALFPKKMPPRHREATERHKAQRNKSVQGQIAVTRVKERQPLTKYMLDDFLPSSKSEEPEKFVVELTPKPPLKMSKDTFTKALVRLLKNKLLMLNNVAAVFYILGASGYITFLTKYMETQFQKSAAGASIFAGVAGILAMVGGFLISGMFISRYKPAPRKLLAWNVVIGIVYILGEIALMYIGCKDNGIQGTIMTNGRLELLTSCNTGCNCNLKYAPVCHEERHHTYFSACHAGCGVASIGANSTTQAFTNCSCLAEPRPGNSKSKLDFGQFLDIETSNDIVLGRGVPPSSTTYRSTSSEATTENLSSFVLDLTSTSESHASGQFSDLSLHLSNVSSLALDLPSTLATKTEAEDSTPPLEHPSKSPFVTEGFASSTLQDEPSTATASGAGTALALGLSQGPETATVTAGPCLVDCARSFLWFIMITCFMHALGSSGKIGNILVNYRCVSTEDKPFAQGLGILVISLFAFIPGPIIYGVIIDSTCLVWNESCSNRGNCWLYHKEDFRFYINLTAACFTSIATFFDGLVWYYGKTLDLYGEPEDETTDENQF